MFTLRVAHTLRNPALTVCIFHITGTLENSSLIVFILYIASYFKFLLLLFSRGIYSKSGKVGTNKKHCEAYQGGYAD